MRLIDRYLPDCDAAEFHSIDIDASPEAIWETLWSLDLGDIPVVKLLFGLRTLPALIFDRRAGQNRRRRLTLADLESAGFGKLAERPGSEVVLGVTGRFWSPVHNVDPFEAELFDSPVEPGRAHAAWDFVVASSDDGGSILSTETRIACGDAPSRRKFKAYWTLVRPFSGLIRVLLLRAVRKAAEERWEKR